jgi:glyoxylate/hydroxypyruvate reductase A
VPEGLTETFPNLRVVFSVGAGIDKLNVPPKLRIVRMLEPGIARQMQEYITLAVLGLHRDLPIYLDRQRHGECKAEAAIPTSERRVGCRRRLNIDPPCRSNIDPGRVANS